uniref:C-terminal processing peptidase-1, Serine peptidase, MEROPS family S41A n=1 Tax=Chlorobium chlorochromatii (strain CaD3) TaxID=340177 RepID=Q3ASM5_CHLCH
MPPCRVEAFWPLATSRAASATTLQPTALHDETGKYISQTLLQYHYRKPATNDSLSLQIFNRYLEQLDGSKSYFVASEVESLRKVYGTRFDDELLAGKSKSGFGMYNFFLKRAKEKMRFMKATADTARFSFMQPEEFELDRKRTPFLPDRRQLTALWRRELKYQWLTLKHSGEKNSSIRAELSKSYASRLSLLQRQTPNDAFQSYMAAVTTSFDPHTSYLSPDDYTNFQIDMSRSLEGIGAKLQTEGQYTVVGEIIPGGPAFKTGFVKKGDKIIAVGQGSSAPMVDVTGWRINDVVKQIRGPKNSIVRLKILPASQGGVASTKVVQLVREKIDLQEQAARKSIIQQNGLKIGVITIPSFYLDFEGQQKQATNYASTSRDVARIVEELQREELSGIILDLRDNGGGSLEEAVNVTGLFITSGPVVQVSNASGGKSVVRDDDRRIFYSGPLAVLVNRYSASASEIVAAAMQDYKRGIVIGERTFGKGTVQSIVKLTRPFHFFGKAPEFGQLKLTVAKFYRISGGSTQHKGVVPDITMPSLIDTSSVGEDTYSSSLPWSTISPALFRPIADVTPEHVTQLRQKQQVRIDTSRLYKTYMRDLATLNRIRKKKSITLQDSSFKSDVETLRQIEKNWGESNELDSTHTKSGGKALERDVLLQQSSAVMADFVELKTTERQTVIRAVPALN